MPLFKATALSKKADGSYSWSVKLSTKLRKQIKRGQYVIYSRAISKTAKEKSFSPKRANVRKFQIKK